MAVSSPADKYARCLYFINGITGLLGIVCMALGIWALTSPDSTLLKIDNTWVLNVIIAFGVIVFVISCLGCQGARVSKDRINSNSTNWWLVFYFVIIFAACIIQLAAASVLLTFNGAITNANAEKWSNTTSDKLEHDVVTWIEDHPAEWIDIQDHYDCCGYGEIVGDMATGAACSYNATTSAVPSACRDDLLTSAEDQILSIAAFAIIISFVEICALVSTCCLCCCISKKEQQEYSRIHNPNDPQHAKQGGYAGTTSHV
jgi:hypothetical protein